MKKALTLIVLQLILQNALAFKINMEKYFPYTPLPIYIDEASYDMFSSEHYVPFTDKDLITLKKELPFSAEAKLNLDVVSIKSDDYIPVGRFRCYHNKWGVLIYHSSSWTEDSKQEYFIELILLFVDLEGNVVIEPKIVSCENSISGISTFCKLFNEGISIGIERKEVRYTEEYVSFPE